MSPDDQGKPRKETPHVEPKKADPRRKTSPPKAKRGAEGVGPRPSQVSERGG
jgi:hypothetical protein